MHVHEFEMVLEQRSGWLREDEDFRDPDWGTFDAAIWRCVHCGSFGVSLYRDTGRSKKKRYL